MTTKPALQVGYNLLPRTSLPRSIRLWQSEAYRIHADDDLTGTRCAVKCGCQPKGSVVYYPERLVRYLRSKPTLSTDCAKVVKGFLLTCERKRVWFDVCFHCHPPSDILHWLDTQISRKRAHE